MTHELYMQRCLQLAKNGFGTTSPNPMVGCVIVLDNQIIGEGWHQKAGKAHAEVNAINSVKDKSLLAKATLYVSLEPCSHFGKTPPCSDLIIENNIPKVVIGTVDPHSKVAGKGIEKLQNAGIFVEVGVLEKKCREINKRFFTFHLQKRPYIILKWAESADGFLAPLHKEKTQPVWITNVYSRQLVHKWRTEEQGILVGTATVLADNPSLNARDWNGENPVRIVLDRSGKIPANFAIKNKTQKTIIFTEQEILSTDENCIYENTIFDNQLIERICAFLFTLEIQSILVEGGAKTIKSFIEAGLWDEARIFKGSTLFQEGTKAPLLKGTLKSKQIINKDELLILTKP